MGLLSRHHRELTGRERIRIAGALVLAAFAGFLGWLGLFWRYSSQRVASPLGTGELVQFAAPIVLGLLMIAAAWLVRGVVLERLQVAVLLSLLVHLLLLFLLQLVPLPSALVQAMEPAEIEGAEELLMPDYGGMEAPQASPESWQTDVAVNTPERQLDDELRQATEPDRPRERESQEAMPQNRVDPAQLEPLQNEDLARELPEMQLEQLARQAIQEPMAPESPAEVPEVSNAQVAEITPRDVAADVKKQSVDTSTPTQQPDREQLPGMTRSTAIGQEATRAEANPVIRDQSSMAPTRRSRSPSAAELRIEATELNAARNAGDFTATESVGALERRRAELARATKATRSARLGEARASASNVSSARSETAPEVTGGSRSAQIARSGSAAGPQGAAGQIEAPRVTGGSAAAGGPRFEPGLSGVSRSAAGTVSGPRGSSPSLASTSDRAGVGAGSTAAVGRAPTRDSIGSPSGAGGGEGASLARGNVGGGVTGAAGVGESIKLSVAPSGTGQAGMAARPDVSNVGRSSSRQVPTRGGSGATTGTGPGLAPTRLGSGTGSTGVAGGPAGRGSDLAPRLGSDSAGAGRPDATLRGRSAPSSGGPQGVSGGIEGEAMALTAGPQPGRGLTPGPQPTGAASDAAPSGGVVGTGTDARASILRRSAELPGSSGSGEGRSPGGALASTGRLSIGAPARRGQADAPQMHPQVSQLARQVPGEGLGKSGLAEMSRAFSLRTGEMRKEAARTLGGTPETERAVEMGIAWLAQHQAPDGSWGIHDFTKQCKGHECDGIGSFESPTAGTGLALLAFLGAGYTHQSGQYQENVARGLKWLVSRQKSDGDLFASEVQFVRYYSHGIAAIALCEAYDMTKDPELREPTQKALQYILDTQHPQLGGWRYEPRSESDTSVSGWQLMALKSGEMAGFDVPSTAYQHVTRWLDSVERGSSGGLYAYHPTRRESLAMTAEGLLMRQYLGFSRNNPRLRAGADHLDRHLPDLSQRDAYYWYYATQMMYHMQGTHWDHWNGRLRDMLTGMQSKEGGTYGSWSATEPTSDRWGGAGGRLYVTCLHLLILEVYYRHLPLYQQLER